VERQRKRDKGQN
jgi:hypothetical protein